jgi:phosphatidylglycerol:prolipoprotein diacylglycerol transferase
MYPPVDPVIAQIGPFALRWYGILLVTGMIVAAWVASRYVERKGEDGEAVWDMLVWVLIPALIGARLYYVFIQAPRGPEGFGRFMENPALIFQVWTGGIHIFGAFIFGGIALFLFARWRNLPLLTYLDGVGLGLPLGQAIGRWANFINQELYGPPTTLPWGLRIDPQHRIPPYNDLSIYPESVRFHPLFLYESLWNFAGFGLLFWISRRYEDRLLPGDIILLYLIWYPLGRFFIEFLRTDSWFFPGTPFNMVHVLSFVAVVASTIILIWRHRRRGSTGSAESGERTKKATATN